MPLRKAHMSQRWIVLTCCSIMMIGSYYCYDNPSALQEYLKVWFNVNGAGGGGSNNSTMSALEYEPTNGDIEPVGLDFEGTQRLRAFKPADRTLLGVAQKSMSKSQFSFLFNLLYSVYSIPNIILPFFGGFFVSKIGARWMNVIFSSCILCGQIVFAFGTSIHSFPIMLAGRVLFGFGGESLCVGQSTIVAQWFEGAELALAMGINLSVSRVGSAVNDKTSPALADWNGVPFALWFGVGICIASLTCAFIVVPIDAKAQARIRAYKLAATSPQSTLSEEEILAEEPVHLSDVKDFPLAFWLLTVSCVVVYGCVMPFNNIASSFIVENFVCNGPCCPDGGKCQRQTDAVSLGNTYMMIPFMISAIASPFLGGLVDKFGYRAVLATVSSVVLTGVHLSLVFLHGKPEYLLAPLAFQGIAYSVYAAALWPSVPHIVNGSALGTAYGVLTAVQNGGLAVFPLLVAFIHNKFHEYKYVEMLFVSFGVLGTVFGVLLNIEDKRSHGGILNAAHAALDDVEDLDIDDALLSKDPAALLPEGGAGYSSVSSSKKTAGGDGGEYTSL